MAVDLVDQERLASVTVLSSGAHSAPNGEFMACVMEAAAFVAGEPWSDHPECTCPVIAAFMRGWNDGLPSDEDRTRLLLPFVPAIVGTKGSEALEERRQLMAADWLVRVHTPVWLRLAGLKDQAATLEALPEITSLAQAPSLRGPLEAVRKDAAAAWAAARDAAGAAAWAAAGDAAGAAARAHAGDAAGAAAMAAARAAAGDTAGDAAWDAAWAAAAARAAAGDAAGPAAMAAAWATAGAAAGAAAWDAAWDAAGNAAGAAAGDAAGAAAMAAAGAASGAAARAAARDALKDTVTELQQSALVLVERMVALTDDDLAKAA